MENDLLNLINQKTDERFFEKKVNKFSSKSLINLLDAVAFRLADPVTVLLGKTELALNQLNNGGMEQKEMKKFVQLCKEELENIYLVFNILRNYSQIEKNYLFSSEESEDRMDQPKMRGVKKVSGSLDEGNYP